MIREKVNRSKDKERHKITSTLRDMSKEDRAIENLFKNHRLERWNKGLQKGLTQYVAKTYDEERAEREKDQILEQQLENRELLGQAITADRDIAMMEAEELMRMCLIWLIFRMTMIWVMLTMNIDYSLMIMKSKAIDM
jgi:hypothetical protein